MELTQLALVGILGTAAFLTYADRTNMGIVIVPMGDDFDWTASTKGTILGAFFVGYICTQIVGGWLADGVLGGEVVLAGGMLIWSVVLLSTPVMASRGLAGAIAARIGLGLAEGFVFPAIHSMLPRRVPANWLTVASSFISSMTLIGGMSALLVSAPLAAHSGWPSVFYLLGGLGLSWCLVWMVWLLTVDRDQLSRKQIVKSRVIPWRTIMTASPAWAYFTCGYCNAWGFWLILSWLPSFFRDVFEADLEHLGYLAVLPYALQGIVGFLIGFLGDYALRHKLVGKRLLRGTAQSISMLGAASLLVALICCVGSGKSALNQYQAVALISAAMALNAFSAAGSSVNHFDLAPRYAGFLYGLGNSASLIPGVIGVPLTGWMLEASGWQWDGVFALATVHYVIGLVVYLLFSSYSPLVKT